MFKALFEAIFKRGKVEFSEQGSSEVTIYPDVNFQNACELLLGDPDIAAAIDFIVSVAAGRGFETSMNSNYTTKTSDDKTAKEVVDLKCKIFNFDSLVQEIAEDIVAYGNSFIWKGNSVKFERCIRILPYWVYRVDFSDSKIKTLHLLNPQDVPNKIDGNEVIWLHTSAIGKDRLGIGILQGLLTPYAGRPPFAHIKAKVQKAMAEQIENFSAYNEVWVFEGLADKDVSTYNARIQQMKKGKRITTNKPAQIIRSIPERMRGLDFYVETLWNSFFLGLKTPYPKLVVGGTFTEAAANSAIRVGDVRINLLRRYLKREIETQFFDVWVAEEGLDPVEAQVRLHWRLMRMPDVNVLLSSLTKLTELGTIKTSEMRKILRDMGLPIEDVEEKVKPQNTIRITAEMHPHPEQPEISALKKYEKTPREY